MEHENLEENRKHILRWHFLPSWRLFDTVPTSLCPKNMRRGVRVPRQGKRKKIFIINFNGILKKKTFWVKGKTGMYKSGNKWIEIANWKCFFSEFYRTFIKKETQFFLCPMPNLMPASKKNVSGKANSGFIPIKSVRIFRMGHNIFMSQVKICILAATSAEKKTKINLPRFIDFWWRVPHFLP